MKQHSTSIRVIAALAVALGVSACAAIPNDTVTRAAMIDAPQRMAPMLLDIQTIRIDVPRTLEVSEKNRFYPGGDIVWRGEPMGDRYMQVGAIFEDAATRDPRHRCTAERTAPDQGGSERIRRQASYRR